jgi:integrase/recombinase XerD
MKSLLIKSSHYNYLLSGYKEYLRILGYSPRVVKGWPVYVREFLHWLESKSIVSITHVESLHTSDFLLYIKKRKNQRNAGALSSGSINNIISAINGFARYLNSTGKYILNTVLHREENSSEVRNILSVEEIKQLYEASFLPQKQNTIAMGQRDRAIIALYYGCGLRRNEGVQLNIDDVDLTRQLIFVRKGKNNKQRHVPIATKHLIDIKDYVQQGREWFLYEHDTRYQYYNDNHGKPSPRKQDIDHHAFLLNKSAQRLDQPEKRLHYLLKAAEIQNKVTLHGLRHSIATHLLQSGMDIEDIAKFLGHRSLTSTQVYTHIINESVKIKNDE